MDHGDTLFGNEPLDTESSSLLSCEYRYVARSKRAGRNGPRRRSGSRRPTWRAATTRSSRTSWRRASCDFRGALSIRIRSHPFTPRELEKESARRVSSERDERERERETPARRLQAALATVAKLPPPAELAALESATRSGAVSELETLTRAFVGLRDATCPAAAETEEDADAAAASRGDGGGGGKRPRFEALWRDIERGQLARRANWERTLESWRRRTHLGALASKHSLRAVNLGPFQQARQALSDRERVKRKIHPKRPDASGDLDEELYDDAPLYRVQLRDFLERHPARKLAATSTTTHNAGDAALSSLAAQPKQRRVRGSKGRALTFKPHDKLQNFMFPIPAPTPNVDVDMLFRSLFKV